MKLYRGLPATVVSVALSVLLMSCYGSKKPEFHGIHILPVRAYLTYRSDEEVRFPLLTVVMPGSTLPTVQQCQLKTPDQRGFGCMMMPLPTAQPGMVAWDIRASLAAGRYRFGAVELGTAAGSEVFDLGVVVVDVLPAKDAPPLRVESYVMLSGRTEHYTAELENVSGSPVVIEGLDFSLAPLAIAGVKTAETIDAQPWQYKAVYLPLSLQVGERRALRFQFADPITVNLESPYYQLRPLLRYSQGAQSDTIPLKLVMYAPDVPLTELFAHFSKR